ncbi:MAG: XTP/dITP diphosphatase [Candidatus Thermoplasmatota archaeon]|nr:XTP/dITP diphosphatase [Candidatus Thermoplasmatota archaeon]
MSQKIYFVTGNPGKYAEMRDLLTGFDLRRKTVPYPEVQADDLEAVARFGLRWLRDRVEAPFILEDAGLFIDALHGFPGVYSAYVFATLGNRGILRLLEGVENRRARFRSVIGLYDGEIHIFSGECRGTLAGEERGSQGFGYDPLFIPEGSALTFAQMTPAEKSARSHRGRAAQNLLAHLEQAGTGGG